jgi:hypothetical protein
MNPARRMLLKCLPAGIASLFVGSAKAAELPKASPAVKWSGAFQADVRREQVLKETAAKVIDWMRLIGYQGRYHAIVADFNRLFRDQAQRLVHPEARVFVGDDVWAPISLGEFIELWEEADRGDGKAVVVLFQDLFVAMLRHFKIGKPVTNDHVEPGINHPIRYVGAKYVKDIDLLRDREHSQQLAYLLGCMLQDVLAVPERETADWLELRMYVNREAFMFECFTYTTHLVPQVVEKIPSGPGAYDFLQSRIATQSRLDYFVQKHGRKPRAVFVNTGDIKDYCKWCVAGPEFGPTLSHYQNLLARAFEAEFGVKLQLFDYVPGGDNDARLIG